MRRRAVQVDEPLDDDKAALFLDDVENGLGPVHQGTHLLDDGQVLFAQRHVVLQPVSIEEKKALVKLFSFAKGKERL